MEAGEEGLRITQSAGRQHLGLIAGGTKTSHQTGLSAALERCEEGQGAGALEILTEAATGEQERHRRTGGRAAVWQLHCFIEVPLHPMVYIGCLCCCTAPVR